MSGLADAGQPGPEVFVYRGGAQVVGGTGGGNLSCEVRDATWTAVLDAVLASADQTCEPDSDCGRGFQLECYYEEWLCGSYETYSTNGVAAIQRALAVLGGGVCEGYEAAGCWSGKPIANCGVLPAPACRGGQCTSCQGAECSDPPGPLSCESRTQMNDLFLGEALASADRTCTSDSDCERVAGGGQNLEVRCPHSDWYCGAPVGVSQTGAASVRAVADRLRGEASCGPEFFSECYSPPPAADCALQETFCADNQCEVCWGSGCVESAKAAADCAPEDLDTGTCQPIPNACDTDYDPTFKQLGSGEVCSPGSKVPRRWFPTWTARP